MRSLAICGAAVVLAAQFPWGGLAGQQRPEVTRVESRSFFSGVNVHSSDPFATRWIPAGARELGTGVRYHLPLTEVALFAQGRRPFCHQPFGGGFVVTQLDVVYTAGLSFRLPF